MIDFNVINGKILVRYQLLIPNLLYLNDLILFVRHRFEKFGILLKVYDSILCVASTTLLLAINLHIS